MNDIVKTNTIIKFTDNIYTSDVNKILIAKKGNLGIILDRYGRNRYLVKNKKSILRFVINRSDFEVVIDQLKNKK